VLGRLRYDAYASLPFVAFLTPPAGLLDPGSIGPALSRPYRFAPMFALNFHQLARDTRVFSVSFSVEDIARYERTGQFPPQKWQPAAQGMRAIFIQMVFRR
jgi:hypothetical protein